MWRLRGGLACQGSACGGTIIWRVQETALYSPAVPALKRLHGSHELRISTLPWVWGCMLLRRVLLGTSSAACCMTLSFFFPFTVCLRCSFQRVY